MASHLTLPAPAKVNLFLHVVGRRNDGYHVLESAMCLVAFGDVITLTLRNDSAIVMATPTPGVAAEDDLCVRAARALTRATGCTLGVEIGLEKRIPMGAGLGGGSSDAASVLLGLNQLWALKLSRARLMEIGLTLGADVPFFIFGRAALARGIGEQLQAISIPAAQITLAKPSVAAPTPLIFAQPDLCRNTPLLERAFVPLNFGHNDLQPVAERLFPAIAAVRNELGIEAKMSGSGSTSFRLDGKTRTALLTIANAQWQCATRLLSQHPLYSFASS